MRAHGAAQVCVAWSFCSVCPIRVSLVSANNPCGDTECPDVDFRRICFLMIVAMLGSVADSAVVTQQPATPPGRPTVPAQVDATTVSQLPSVVDWGGWLLALLKAVGLEP